jgi:glutamyl-tRNA synthetase
MPAHEINPQLPARARCAAARRWPGRMSSPTYRGRLAPSPTGYLHLGHARTFWTAQERASACGGTLILRNENIDATRFKLEFVEAMLEDLRWFGFTWSEGPDIGGPFGPYNQSERMDWYRAALAQLRAGNFIYPCTCSHGDIRAAVTAPHGGDDELIYPGTCRPKGDKRQVAGDMKRHAASGTTVPSPRAANWRFRVPDGEIIAFMDGNFGSQKFVAGKDFGDFVVWRGDNVPAYQLACVVDDAAMKITEVVRGADLLVSTARQVLLYRALGLPVPEFCHCALMVDEQGERLAKRHNALSLRILREQGNAPERLRGDRAFQI